LQIRNYIFHFAFSIARAEFEKFAFLYAYAPNMHLGLEALRDRGFYPKTIVDVGAFEGKWTQMVKSIWPKTQIAMIEPNREKSNLLASVASELDAQLYCDLIGAEDGLEVIFNVMGAGSSIYEERSNLPRSKESHKLKKLDTLLNNWNSIDLLKIDAQGYELEILKGAERLIANTSSILLEVAIIEINENAPLLHDITVYMNQKGFVAYEILEIHRRPLDKALNQIDILYIPKDSPLIADKRHF
jgi:FkbM family methyltransferase